MPRVASTKHRAVPLEGGREQLDAAVEQHRGVDVAQAHRVGTLLPRS